MKTSTAIFHVVVTTVCSLVLSFTLSRADMTLALGDGFGYPGGSGQVVVSLDNQSDKVRGVQADICDTDNYLTCFECSVSSRAADFQCLFNELENGCCRVQFFPLGMTLVNEGTGPLFTLSFDISEDAPVEACRDLSAEGIKIANEDGDPFPPAEIAAAAGEVCFLKISPVTITPNPIRKSYLIPLPYVLVIHGIDTHFKPLVTRVDFSPDSAVVPFFPVVRDEDSLWILVWVMPYWWSEEENQAVTVTVSTEKEVVEGKLYIQLRSFPQKRHDFLQLM